MNQPLLPLETLLDHSGQAHVGLPEASPQLGPILLVDDLPENLEIFGKVLRAAGYPVRAANNGEAALRFATLEPLPELILLDVMMPDMDGYTVLRRLREQASTRDIPVLFLTALGDAADIAVGLRLGAADYITKPALSEVLLARVRTQLEAKRVRDWLRVQNSVLEAEVRQRVAEIERIREDARRAQALLAHQRELILASASDGIFGVDAEGIIHFANPAAAALLGYPLEHLPGRAIFELLQHTADSPNPICLPCLAGSTIQNREETFWHQDGSPLNLMISCQPILEDGRRIGAVVTLHDQTEHKRYLEQIERKSNFDDLTGLPNRNLLHDRLARALGRSRDEHGELAVLALNIDRYKTIVDSFGHAAADRVLAEVAARLAACVASTHTLARLEGDEFVLVAEAGETEAATQLAQPLLAALNEPFRSGEREFTLTASIGIALCPKDGDSGDALLSNAVAAMYRAKAAGGNRFNFYTLEMNIRSLERLDMENALRKAIACSQLVLHYQPQVSLRSGEIIGAEALVRWQHPERGLVMPGEFIPLAEDCGLIVPLGAWVLRTACAQAKAWQNASLPAVSVAVNMSARQFAAQDVVELSMAALAETGLDPAYLELELTESMALADVEAFIRATDRLKKLAVKLSIDDFGTGFSSLAYLKRFAIDRLKIDRSFVRDIPQDSGSAAIALAVATLAHSLKLSVIAEGVESAAQLAFLRQCQCDEMQGYFFSPPVPAAAFARLLRERRRLRFDDHAAQTKQTPSG